MRVYKSDAKALGIYPKDDLEVERSDDGYCLVWRVNEYDSETPWDVSGREEDHSITFDSDATDDVNGVYDWLVKCNSIEKVFLYLDGVFLKGTIKDTMLLEDSMLTPLYDAKYGEIKGEDY